MNDVAWAAQCRQAQGQATMMAQMSLPHIGQLMLSVTDKFCANQSEVAMGTLAEIMQVLSSADSIARRYPQKVPEIMQRAAELCECTVPRTSIDALEISGQVETFRTFLNRC